MRGRMVVVTFLGWLAGGCITNLELVELCEDQNEKWGQCGFEDSPDECGPLGSLEPTLAQQAELVCRYRCQIDATCAELAVYACTTEGDEESAIEKCFDDCEYLARENFYNFETERPEPCSTPAGGAGGEDGAREP